MPVLRPMHSPGLKCVAVIENASAGLYARSKWCQVRGDKGGLWVTEISR